MLTKRKPDALLLGGLILLAVLARAAGWREQTNDMRIFLMWYHDLNGGWRAIGADVGNYNAPFVYLLAFLHLVPGPLIFKLKAVFVLCDVVLAFFAYRIVDLRFPGKRAPMVAAMLVVLLPTVVINASLWGQMDAMWAAPALGGVYFLLRDRPWAAVTLATIAIAVKPQGIFLFPLLLLFALAGRLPWRTLLAAPAVFLAADLPALVAGRDPVELLTIYDLGRQSHQVSKLTLNAPSIYAFAPPGTDGGAFRTLGVVLAVAAALGICWLLVARGGRLTQERTIMAASVFAIGMPFLLPGMHERYFFLADVLTVLLAIHRPRLWFVPLLVQAGSLLAYTSYVFGTAVLPLPVAAVLMLAALVTLTYRLIKDVLAWKDEDFLAEWAELSRPSAERRELLPTRRA
jgi:Gpi18-like mannosyltransferase